MNTQAIIMAGGEGKRMQSSIPKVLHMVMGEPMIVRIIKKVLQLQVDKVYIVCGRAMQQIQETIKDYVTMDNIIFVNQPVPRGTGDAVRQCLPFLKTTNMNVLILNGDTPLVDSALDIFIKSSVPALMVTSLDNPHGNGRVLTDDNGAFVRIVEEKDASDQEKAVTLVNCGVYLVSSTDIVNNIPRLTTNNAQNEYYLTDLCGFLQDQLTLVQIPRDIQYELCNVNSRADLLLAERYAISKQFAKLSMVIRRLAEDDHSKGYFELLSELSNTVDDKSTEQFKKVFCKISQNQNHHIFVVEDTMSQKIIANVVLLVETKFIHNGMNVGHIEDVVVASGYRSRKIGKLLVDYITTFMIEFDCYKLILDCEKSLECFYGKSGYKHKNIQMSLYRA